MTQHSSLEDGDARARHGGEAVVEREVHEQRAAHGGRRQRVPQVVRVVQLQRARLVQAAGLRRRLLQLHFCVCVVTIFVGDNALCLLEREYYLLQID